MVLYWFGRWRYGGRRRKSTCHVADGADINYSDKLLSLISIRDDGHRWRESDGALRSVRGLDGSGRSSCHKPRKNAQQSLGQSDPS